MVGEVLDHRIPLHVPCREVPIDSLVISYQLGGGLQAQKALGSNDEGRHRNGRSSACFRSRVGDSASRTTETLGDLFECVEIKLSQVVHTCDTLNLELIVGVSGDAHLVGAGKEDSGLSGCEDRGHRRIAKRGRET